MSCNPTTAFIFPDPVLAGPRNVESATSQAGACPPTVVTGDDNCGSLVPVLTGTPASTGQFQLLLHRSGTRAESGFVYRRATSGDYIGGDDGRKFWRVHSAFTTAGTPNAEGTSAAYCAVDDTVVTACIDGTQIRFNTRGAHAGDYDGWTSTTLTLSSIGAPTPGGGGATLHRIAMAETADGILLLAYTYEDGGNRIAIIKSSDCATTWSLLHDDLLESTNDIADPGGQIQLTVSGRWVRLDWLDQGEDHYRSRASSDNGLSWSPTVESVDAAFILNTAGPALDPAPYGVASLGSGQFLMVFSTGAGGNFIRLAAASNTGAWTLVPSGVGTVSRQMPAVISGLVAVRAHDRIYALVAHEDGVGTNTGDQLSMYYHPLAGILEHGPGIVSAGTPAPGEWQPVEPLTGMIGARYVPVLLRGLNLGRSLFFHWGVFDHESSVEIAGAKPVAELSGSTVRSLGNVGPGGDLTTLSGFSAGLAPMYEIQWATPFGEPAGGASSSANTAWTRTVVGTPTFTWSTRQLNIVTGVADRGFYRETRASSTSDSWSINHAELAWVFQVTSGSQTALLHGLAIRTQRTVAGQELQIEIRADAAGLRVHDVVAASDLETLAIDLTDWTEVRLTLFNDSGWIWASRLDDYLNPVESASFFTFTSTGVGSPADEVSWGAPGTGTGDSDWRELWVSEFTGSITFSNPEDLLPLATTTEASLLLDGVSVSWGGGSGARADTWESRDCFGFPASAALRDEQTIGWRSTDLADQSLIFVADPDDPEERFVHNAIMLDGFEDFNVTIDYDDNAAFSSPTPAVLLSSTTHVGLEVLSVDGNTIVLTPASVATAELFQGELAGQRCRFVVSGPATYVFLVSRHPTTGTIDLVQITDAGPVAPDLAGLGLVATDLLTFFLPYGRIDLPVQQIARFMRLRFLQDETATDDHRLGAIVAGTKVEVPFELEWSHTDDEQSGVELITGPWTDSAFRRGAHPRVWVGRIVNDYVQWRESLRAIATSMSDYQVRPMALIMDEADPRRIIRARYSPDPHEQSFWIDGAPTPTRTRPGGDQTLRFTQVR